MKTIGLAAAAGLLAAWSAAAEDASPPAGGDPYAAARRGAPHHLQMTIEKVEPLPWYQDHGACVVKGKVVRVFRGGHAAGEALAVPVDCAKPRAALGKSPALWTSWRALEEAGVLEAYLDADGKPARWQTVLLSEPSEEPACPEATEGSC